MYKQYNNPDGTGTSYSLFRTFSLPPSLRLHSLDNKGDYWKNVIAENSLGEEEECIFQPIRYCCAE
ncbi:MAG: hypothetical protein KAQ85_05550 [Thermodesulfovibrionia bacterium]|nr:hypothetical protein [Thermodesulfovibrionia bacterium]